jgi:hypothetical protein
MEFQRLGLYYLRYINKKELGCKENHEIQHIGIEEYKGNITVDKSQVLKNWKNYITGLYDRPEESNLKTKLKGFVFCEVNWKKLSRG